MKPATLQVSGLREMLSRDQMKLIIGEYGNYGGITCRSSVIIHNKVIEAEGACASSSIAACNQYVVNWCTTQYDQAGVAQGECSGGCA